MGVNEPIYKGELPKKGGWTVGQFVDIGGLGKKEGGGVFEGGLIPQCTQLDALLHKTCVKVLRLNMCTSMISLNKIAHQMWRNHPFSERGKTTE